MNYLLNDIASPEDLRQLTIPQLAQLSREIRQYLISTVSQTGGHLAPSLGVVELTIALHYNFNTPNDKLVWDVGHQAYIHKILTGRKDRFNTLRQYKGLSGFPNRFESEYDTFGVGHASTSISAAFGMACARDMMGEDYKVLAIIGDGALTGGLAYEGLNNAGASGRDFIVILNDNSMSISPNVGAMSKYLTNLISNPIYNRIKKEVWDFTGRFDGMGTFIRRAARRAEEGVKAFITPGLLFERLGFRYWGPVDGHNLAGITRILREVKKFRGPILVHVQTQKGKGFEPAEKNAPVFHGLGKFDPETGKIIKKSANPSYSRVFGQAMVDLAAQDDKVVALTAAMELGTGLSEFAKTYPERFYDVGIAEGHAVTFAAGMAAQGMKPVCAIYSSFLQRAYDMVIHDVALQKLPVIFALDRAGLVGDDGPTHHGVFDMAFLRTIPGMVIMSPKDENELRHMLYTASLYDQGPVALRYPRGEGEGVPVSKDFIQLPVGKSEMVRPGREVAIVAIGHMVYPAVKAAEELEEGNRTVAHCDQCTIFKTH
ncbi:MAG: 1-deoxy-D-xylulose-5-phosphate synthase [candidate division KSB1 bacterium]|nr:1-deoxy-D-xylulose-5-phosphate synthase [candidate division KSB1 bacterium]